MSDPSENSANFVFIWPGLVATPLGTNPVSTKPVNNPVLNQRKRVTITLNAQQLQKCVPIGKPIVFLPNTSNGTRWEQQQVTALPSLFSSPTETSTLPLKYQLMFTKQPTTPSSGQAPAQCNTVSEPGYILPSKDLLQKDTPQPQTSLVQTLKQSSACKNLQCLQEQRSFVVVTKDSEKAMGSCSIESSTAQPTSHGSETPKQGDTPQFPKVSNVTPAPLQQKQTKLLNSQILRQENIMSVPDKAGSKKEKHVIVTVPPTSGTQKRRRLVVITKELGKAKGRYLQIPKCARKIVKSGNIILTPTMGKPKGKQVKLGLSSSSITPATSTLDIQSSTDGSHVQRRLVVVMKGAENSKRRLLVFTKDSGDRAKGTGSIKSSNTQPKGKILKRGNPPKVPETLNPTKGRPVKQKQGNLSNSSNNQTQRCTKTLSSPTKNPHSGEKNKEKQQLKVILPHLSSPKSIDKEKLDQLEKLSKLHSMVKDFSNEVNFLNKRFQSQLWPLEADKQREQMADPPTKKLKVAKEQDKATEIPTVYESPPMDLADEDTPMEDEIKWELDEHELPTLLKGKLESSVNNRHQQEKDPLTLNAEPNNQQNVSLQRDLLEVKTEQDDHQNVPLQQGSLAENTQPIIGSHQDEPLPQDPLLIKPEQFVDNCRSVSSQLDPSSVETDLITEDGTFLSPCNVLPDSQLISFGNLLDTPSEHDPLTIGEHLLEIKTEPDV